MTCLIIAILTLLPIIALIYYAWQGAPGLWPHLMGYVLPHALKNTLILLTGTGILVMFLGCGLAWLITAYDFPFRNIMNWALLLPLTVPTYIIAYAYLDLWHPVGVLQTGLRDLLGYNHPRDLQLPEIRSMGGCIFLLSMVLYPYVYLPTKAVFQMQATGLIEAAQVLGAGPWRAFFKVAFPLARPALAVGTSIALMEALNDIGATEFLGVRTLTVSIYDTWINRSSLAGAAQIALFMLAIVFILITLERIARRHQQYAANVRLSDRLTPRKLRGVIAWLVLSITLLPLLFGFILPVSYLGHAAAKRIHFAGIDQSILKEILNTLYVSALATLIALIFAFILTYTLRQARTKLTNALVRIASVGYAVPGTVLALGILAPIGWLDNQLAELTQRLWDYSGGLFLSGSIGLLVYVYVIRFLALGNGPLESGFAKIPYTVDEVAHTLGANATTAAYIIHIPLNWPAITTATLLIFIDCIKELPATLLLRPLNFETLATHLYGEAVRGTYESGSVAALCIVLMGLPLIILLSRLNYRSKKSPLTYASPTPYPAP